MMIAIIGWGSLIWCPQGLRIGTLWHKDGPRLPIEFARISDDERLTLVIVDGVPVQRTYWALSEFSRLNDALANLKERENTPLPNIHSAIQDGHFSDQMPGNLVATWLRTKPEISAAIWTGLPSNWTEKEGQPFTPERAVDYLRRVSTGESKAVARRVRQYVTHAPSQIQTHVRAIMRSAGWHDVELASALFDPLDRFEIGEG